MDFTHTDRFLLGIFVGLLIASFVSILIPVIIAYVISGALVCGAYLLGKRWLEKKFRIGL